MYFEALQFFSHFHIFSGKYQEIYFEILKNEK